MQGVFHLLFLSQAGRVRDKLTTTLKRSTTSVIIVVLLLLVTLGWSFSLLNSVVGAYQKTSKEASDYATPIVSKGISTWNAEDFPLVDDPSRSKDDWQRMLAYYRTKLGPGTKLERLRSTGVDMIPGKDGTEKNGEVRVALLGQATFGKEILDVNCLVRRLNNTWGIIAIDIGDEAFQQKVRKEIGLKEPKKSEPTSQSSPQS